jgi:hypothetical protein
VAAVVEDRRHFIVMPVLLVVVVVAEFLPVAPVAEAVAWLIKTTSLLHRAPVTPL